MSLAFPFTLKLLLTRTHTHTHTVTRVLLYCICFRKGCTDRWACAEDYFLINLARRCTYKTLPSTLMATSDNFGHDSEIAAPPTMNTNMTQDHSGRVSTTIPPDSRLCVLARAATSYSLIQSCIFIGSLQMQFTQRQLGISVIFPAANASAASEYMRRLAATCPFAQGQGAIDFIDVANVDSGDQQDYGYHATNYAVRELMRRGDPPCNNYLISNLDNYYSPYFSKTVGPYIAAGTELIGFSFTSHYTVAGNRRREFPNIVIRPKWMITKIDLGAAIISHTCLQRAPQLFHASSKPLHGCKDVWMCADGVLFEELAPKCRDTILSQVLLFHQ